MPDQLNNKRVAILATDGVEYVELIEPKKALEGAGAKTEVISPKSGKIRGWNHTDWGSDIPVDRELKSADPKRLRRAHAARRCHESGSSSPGCCRGSLCESFHGSA